MSVILHLLLPPLKLRRTQKKNLKPRGSFLLPQLPKNDDIPGLRTLPSSFPSICMMQ